MNEITQKCIQTVKIAVPTFVREPPANLSETISKLNFPTFGFRFSFMIAFVYLIGNILPCLSFATFDNFTLDRKDSRFIGSRICFNVFRGRLKKSANFTKEEERRE